VHVNWLLIYCGSHLSIMRNRGFFLIMVSLREKGGKKISSIETFDSSLLAYWFHGKLVLPPLSLKNVSKEFASLQLKVWIISM
jgi:hypothetical protein